MAKRPTYEELERKIRELEKEKFELIKASSVDSKNGWNAEIASKTIPEKHLSDIELKSLINIEEIQSIMDEFHYLTNMVTAVLDTNGKVIEATGWQDICTKFHRINAQTALNCTESDLFLAKKLKPGEYVDYKCKNGLWDVVTPLYVGQKHLGNIYTGQFFYDDDEIDEELFIKQAKVYGFEKDSYMDAFHRIPRYTRETIGHLMNFLVKFTAYISKVSLANHKLEKEITERKRAEEALKESEFLFSQMFEQSTTSTCLYNPDGTVNRVNDEFCKMFGVEEKIIIDAGYNVWKDHATIETGVIPLLKDIFHNKETRNWETAFDIDLASASTGTPTSRTGKIFIEVFGYPVLNHEGDLEYVVLQHYDITDRKLAEKEKAHLEGQLNQARKMEAVGTLAGGIAHDFNNILGIILGNAELAIDDVPDWNPARQSLDEVRKACLRAKDVVRQILRFSRKSEIEQKPINLASVVGESLKLSRASIPTSIEIRRNIANDVDDILGDPTQIHQVMINLCTNAAYAMENDGGILEVTLENTEVDEDTASQYPELNPGPHVHLGVSDTGDGIKPEILDRVFDPYFTTKDVGKGTGMGLAVVHGIVKSHHGSISVESKPGKGTTFNILFPTVEREIKDETKVFEELPTGNERILFVDDEESMVTLNRQRLERLGYKVIGETDSSEALEFFHANRDQIDLIITDMTMPKMTGDRLAQEILKIRPDIPIILCTGYSERMSEDRAQEIGIRKYIEKPIEMVKLAGSVREILDDKSIG